MNDAARDALRRAERIAALEEAAGMLYVREPMRRECRPLIAAALAALLALYPGLSAAAAMLL